MATEPEAAARRTTFPWLAMLPAALGLAGCGAGSAPADLDAPRLRVEYAGCETVLEGPVCVLPGDRRLRLWVQSDTDAIVELAGVANGGESPVEVQQGLRYEVEIPPQTAELRVHSERRGASASWLLALREPAPPEWLQRFLEIYRRGERRQAERLLHERLAGLPAEERGKALGLLARVELGKGASDQASSYFEEALLWHREAGRTYDLVDDATALAYLLIYDAQDFPRARSVLDALPEDWGGPAEASYYLSYYRGLLAKENGDLRSALRHLETAGLQAERLGLTRLWRTAEHPLAVMLQRVGRYAEAEAVARRLWREAPAELVDCDRAQLLNNLAWTQLLAREAGEPADDPTPLLEQTLEIFRRHGCPEFADEQVNVLLNLALAHLHENRTAVARERLDEAAALGELAEPRLELWRLDLEGRLALRRGSPQESLEHYLELAERAAAAAVLEAEWRAMVGRAQALHALGEPDGSLMALARADALLSEMSFAVALREGRETFVARYRGATELYLDLLLDAGRPAEALAVARRSRSRVLQGLRRQDRLAKLSPAEQQTWSRAVVAYRARRDALERDAAEDWRLPADERRRARSERQEQRRQMLRALEEAQAVVGESYRPAQLPPPQAGEIMLVFHPLPEGWVGFAADRRGVIAERLFCVEERLSAGDLGRCLLQPFARRIEQAETVRILPYGPLREVDFHALRFAGDVLLASKPVVYPLDLAAAGSGGGDGLREPPRALLVADPGGDLPAARGEALMAAAALKTFDGGWEVVSLSGEQAGGDTVRRRLIQADLFHYAGHAVFEGSGGWDSGLPLADGTRLTVGDILALPRVPRWVVLSGCETGRSGQDAPQEGIGLANAFAAAGSSRVVAAVRPVADADARALVREFYREWSGSAAESVALQRAVLALRRDRPRADWSSFRIIEP